jgi:lipoyl(octanoyl) transferase
MIAPRNSADLAAAAGEVQAVEWRVASAPVPYPKALQAMTERADAIHRGEAGELVWLLEHPPLYTAGTSADPAELFNPQNFPVYEAGRGGRYTYHGPGQRVGYVMVDLDKRARDVRRYVHGLEQWLIGALAEFRIAAYSVPDRIGIWVRKPDGGEAKIGAIGVRVRRWITLHGFSLNLCPELSHFSGIVPCGITDFPVTSLAELGVSARREDLDRALNRGLTSFLISI